MNICNGKRSSAAMIFVQENIVGGESLAGHDNAVRRTARSRREDFAAISPEVHDRKGAVSLSDKIKINRHSVSWIPTF